VSSDNLLFTGPPGTNWRPCQEHGIALSRCWSCSKPGGLCSYGHCPETPTHVVGGRECCEQDARSLALINGGTVSLIREREPQRTRGRSR
jgi:hypothetical protein